MKRSITKSTLVYLICPLAPDSAIRSSFYTQQRAETFFASKVKFRCGNHRKKMLYIEEWRKTAPWQQPWDSPIHAHLCVYVTEQAFALSSNFSVVFIFMRNKERVTDLWRSQSRSSAAENKSSNLPGGWEEVWERCPVDRITIYFP